MMLLILTCLSSVFIMTASDNVCDNLFTECQALLANYEQQRLPTQCETLQHGLECLDQINQSCSVDVIRKTMIVQQQVYGIFWKCEADLNKQGLTANTSEEVTGHAGQPAASRNTAEKLRPLLISALLTTASWLLAPTALFT